MTLTYRTIGESWLAMCQMCLHSGRRYTIQRGSYVGSQRAQLDFVAFEITQPWDRPLGIEFGGLAISDDESIKTYFEDYLIGNLLNPNRETKEQYTYGERLGPYLLQIIDMLRDTPDTNQACLNVGVLGDVFLPDPPCLRVLDWKVKRGELIMTSFWRSHDAFAGLPMNLGGLQLMFEMIADGADLIAGSQVVVETGLHVYEHNWSMLK